MLVGTDLSGHADSAVTWAFHVAATRSMPLTLMHAVFDGRPVGTIPAEEPTHQYLRVRLSNLADEFRSRFPSVDCQVQLFRGLPDEAMIHAAAGMDMVVVGSHLRRSVLGMLDANVPKGVIERAPRFVAVVPTFESGGELDRNGMPEITRSAS